MSKKRTRSRRNAAQDQTTMGIAWYRREQWPLLLQTPADRADLEDTYDEWLIRARKTMADLTAHGARVLKVPVDLGDLLEWCDMEGCQNDGAARASYTSEKLWEMSQEQ